MGFPSLSLLGCLIALVPSHGTELPWVHLHNQTIKIWYTPGGCTDGDLKRRYHASIVRCGGYSTLQAPSGHRLHRCPRCHGHCKHAFLVGVDLVWHHGHTYVPYQKRLARPVLVITRDNRVRIDWPTHKGWLAHSGDREAMAGNTIKAMPDPGRTCLRQLVFIREKGRSVAFVRMWGNQSDCYHLLKHHPVGWRSVIMLDGGHEAADGQVNPIHIGICTLK